MKKHPIWFLIIGIAVLVIPTAVYLAFLVPKLTEEYNVLMASGGVIAGGGFYGANAISEKVKYGKLFKMAAKSFTLLTVVTLVQEFIIELVGLVAVFVMCFIVFQILKGEWKDGKRKRENTELAEAIARSITETSK